VRLDTDPYLSRYAERVSGLAASEIRALFSVVERPEIVSFAGGMPDISVMDLDLVADLTAQVVREQGAIALQYGLLRQLDKEPVKVMFIDMGEASTTASGWMFPMARCTCLRRSMG
jgi:DNA-binding transcriptional MocR family regulator